MQATRALRFCEGDTEQAASFAAEQAQVSKVLLPGLKIGIAIVLCPPKAFEVFRDDCLSDVLVVALCVCACQM